MFVDRVPGIDRTHNHLSYMEAITRADAFFDTLGRPLTLTFERDQVRTTLTAETDRHNDGIDPTRSSPTNGVQGQVRPAEVPALIGYALPAGEEESHERVMFQDNGGSAPAASDVIDDQERMELAMAMSLSHESMRWREHAAAERELQDLQEAMEASALEAILQEQEHREFPADLDGPLNAEEWVIQPDGVLSSTPQPETRLEQTLEPHVVADEPKPQVKHATTEVLPPARVPPDLEPEPEPEPETETETESESVAYKPGLYEQIMSSLQSLDVGELRTRATQEGVPAARIEAAADSRDPKGELKALIVCSIIADLRAEPRPEFVPISRTSSGRAEELLRAELATLDVGQLCSRAKMFGIAPGVTERARNSHHPVEELVLLLVAQVVEQRAAGIEPAELLEQQLDKLRLELAFLNVAALCARAQSEGVDSKLVDGARMRLDVAPKDALIALLVAHRSQQMGGAKRRPAVERPANVPPQGP